eukprot:g10349.t1
MSPFRDQPALRQYKSDTKADFEAEARFRERTKASLEAQVLSDVQQGLQYSTTTLLSDGQRGRLDSPLDDEEFSFVPLAGKKDMASYYYQYGVDSPRANRLLRRI